ncbi:hypothetical protein [Streptomyces sp. NPDC003077]|uniref:hypothetical protein n=1 Tax=Streptomyces sp. NPDC003077 TaxID=3154443 RepID=UPI0033AE7341
MSTPVDAERAWADLQRIRVPQERVYDEMERSTATGWRGFLPIAAAAWIYLVISGLELPLWGLLSVTGAYVAVLGGMAVRACRKSRMRLHHTRYSWRSGVAFLGAGAVTGATVILSGRLVDWAELPFGSVIQATVTVGLLLLFGAPVNRWAIAPLRGRGGSRP